MSIQFANLDNEDVDFDFLDESQKASEVIFQEYFADVIITSTGQIKFWNGSAYISKPLKVWDGSSWVIKPLKFWDGFNWITTNY